VHAAPAQGAPQGRQRKLARQRRARAAELGRQTTVDVRARHLLQARPGALLEAEARAPLHAEPQVQGRPLAARARAQDVPGARRAREADRQHGRAHAQAGRRTARQVQRDRSARALAEGLERAEAADQDERTRGARPAGPCSAVRHGAPECSGAARPGAPARARPRDNAQNGRRRAA